MRPLLEPKTSTNFDLPRPDRIRLAPQSTKARCGETVRTCIGESIEPLVVIQNVGEDTLEF